MHHCRGIVLVAFLFILPLGDVSQSKPRSTLGLPSSSVLSPPPPCLCFYSDPSVKGSLVTLQSLFFHTGSTSGGLAKANFANFDNFPKSCSADFGSFSSSAQTNSTEAAQDAVQSTSVPADRYAALADLDNKFSSAKTEQGKLLLTSLLRRFQDISRKAVK